MRKNRGLKIAILVVLIFTIVLLSNFKILFYNGDFYFDQFEKTDAYSKFHTNPYELGKSLSQVLGYLAYERDGFDLQLTVNNDEILTQDEKLHMKDVKERVQNSFFLLKWSFVLFIALLIINIKDKYIIKKSFKYSGIALISFSVIILLWSLIHFDSIFYLFHRLLFTGNWEFPMTSKLLMLFPLQFFINAAKNIFGGVFASGILFWIISR